MKKIISTLTALLIAIQSLNCVLIANSAESKSGSCGVTATWTFTSDGTLTISGTGKMNNYEDGIRPWASVEGQIKKVVINDGIEYIGQTTFHNHKSLVEVQIPGSVKKVGSYAFWYCESLEKVTLG